LRETDGFAFPHTMRALGRTQSGVVEPECKLNAPMRPRKHMRCVVVLKRRFRGGGTQTAKPPAPPALSGDPRNAALLRVSRSATVRRGVRGLQQAIRRERR